jgi:hypothetical protein
MVNRPSIEPSGLIGMRVIVPHATSREDKAYGRSDGRGQTRGELWQFFLHRVSDSREEGLQPSLLVTGRRRDAVSEHRGLSSGVASGKSVGSR